MPEMTTATGPTVALADDRGPADMPPARRRWTAVAAVGVPVAALSPSKSN